MFAKAKAAAAAAAMAAKQAAEEADRRYGISDAVTGATAQAASVAERVDVDGKRAFLTGSVARMTEQAASVAERVDLDGKKALFHDGVAMVTTKATAFIEDSLAETCDLCYCTRRLVTMPMPGPPPNTLHRLARDLHAAHGTHFMVWNLSEVSYDYSTFHDQVLEFRFPGHPAPPLELLVRICNSVENWLAADAENVAVVHCRTGKRRTCTVIACLMAWLGAASDPLQAMQVVAQRRGIPISSLTIPSQRRYIRYFDRVLHGDKPSLRSKRLQRIIVNTIPNLREQGEEVSSHGCSVELQLLQNADLELTADVVLRCSHMRTASDDGQRSLDAAASSSMSASAGGGAGEADRLGDQAATRSGDRDEHLASEAVNTVVKFDQVPMWRTAFNVGYVQAGLLRLTRDELDGIAPNDARYDPDFFVDVIFHNDGDDDDDDSTSLDGKAASQSPSLSSIWQHVDRRSAHVAEGGHRSAASSKQPKSESALDSNSTPTTSSWSAESVNFAIDFDDSGVALGNDDNHDLARDSRADDPAAQWLGKVQAFEELEMFSVEPAGDNVDTMAQPRVPAVGDDDALDDEGPSQLSSSVTAAVALDAEVERQKEAPPRNTGAQQDLSCAAATAVSAAVAAAVAAADDVHAQKAARTAAMAPAADSTTEKVRVETTTAGVHASDDVGTDGTTTPTVTTARTTSKDSFDNWLEDDVGKFEPPPTEGSIERPAPAALPAPATPAAAAVPVAKSASDDLDDFMASLDDL